MNKRTGLMTGGTLAAMAALALLAPDGAQAQVNDKWVTVVMSAEPPDLDGCQSARQHQGRVVKYNVVETLVDRNINDGSLRPRLAVSWTRVDPLNWKFKLREGVTFHDGTPFNAKNAKWSLERTFGKQLVCSDKNRAFNDISAEVIENSEYEITLKTSRPEPILPLRMANVSIVAPATAWDKNSLAPIGTGPFTFQNWQVGQQILLKRNDKYWGPKPQVEGIRYIWRPESSVRAAMIKVGEADIALGIAQQDATDPELDFSHLDSETLHLRLDTALAPLNDKRVRLALNYAVNRQAMVGSILPKTTLYATQLVVPPILGHNHALDKAQKSFDPEKAKALLAEAKKDGVPVDTEILLISYPSNFANAGEVMEAVYAMYKAVGLNIKLMTVEPGQYSSWNNKPYPNPRSPYILQSSHDNANGDPVFTVIQKYGCDGASSGFCDPEFDKEAVRVSGLEGDARTAGWQEIWRKQYEEIIPDVPLFHMIGFTRVNKRIKYVPDVSTNNEIRAEAITFK